MPLGMKDGSAVEKNDTDGDERMKFERTKR